MIFPHPDQRLVELSPQGPITYAFWRWTIRPGNDTSAIVEPLTLEYYNTHLRARQQVTISAQRVAYGEASPRAGASPEPRVAATEPAPLPGWPMAGLAIIVFAAGLTASFVSRRISDWSAVRGLSVLDPLVRRLWQAARSGDARQTRRCATQLIARDGVSVARSALLAELDARLFNPAGQDARLTEFARKFMQAAPPIGRNRYSGGVTLKDDRVPDRNQSAELKKL
jgi:hypothetical protein